MSDSLRSSPAFAVSGVLPSVATGPACKDCKFWWHVEGNFGQCRRYAPRPISKEDSSPTDVMGVISGWASTYEVEWCGEYVQRSNEVVAVPRPEAACGAPPVVLAEALVHDHTHLMGYAKKTAAELREEEVGA